ncbi:restriction endonuclease subunit S [Patescibacteria group bacterium]|nr:restriction endonuclease subunit S [Patescibacteria group bacterium]
MKSNWPTKKLTDLLETCDTGVWGKPTVKDKGLLVLRSTNMDNDGHLDFSDVAERKIENDVKKVRLSDGDILVEKSGGGPDQPVGRVVYFVAPSNRVYSFANFIQRLRAKPDVIDSKFLFYHLLFLHKIGLTKKLQSQTTGIRNLKLSLYLKTEIPIPSLIIQKRIVERLDKIAEAQKLNDELIQKTDELFQSLLHQELNPAGKDWQMKKLSDIGDIVTGTTPSTKNAEYWNGEFLWATPTDIKEDTFILSDTPKKLSREGYGKTRPVPKNAILVTCIASIGKMVLAGKEMATNQQINSIVCSKEANPFFVFFSLQRNKRKLISLGKTTAVPIINKSEFGRIKIPLPPLKAQEQIVAKLSAVQEYKKQLLDQKVKLKELFDSTLSKSMKGEMDK